MHYYRVFFNPFTLLMIIFFMGVMVLIFPLLFFSIVGTTFTKLGFTWREALLILMMTLAGSFINIPVKTIQNQPVRVQRGFSLMERILYQIPEIAPTTTVAVNVGGALIPVLISLYLLYESVVVTGGWGIIISALLGIALVTVVTNRAARPVPGLGIVTPFFIPPMSALFCGLLLSLPLGVHAAMGSVVIAYTSGTMGTLVGADLLNLGRIPELGAPVVSIGGAGTFDGVFLSGVIAAFLA